MSTDIVTFRKQLSETLNRVAYGGERIILTRHGKNAVAIVPIDDLALLQKLEDKTDVRAARAALRESGEVPWEQVKAELGLRGRGNAGRNGTKRRATRATTTRARD